MDKILKLLHLRDSYILHLHDLVTIVLAYLVFYPLFVKGPFFEMGRFALFRYLLFVLTFL